MIALSGLRLNGVRIMRFFNCRLSTRQFASGFPAIPAFFEVRTPDDRVVSGQKLGLHSAMQCSTLETPARSPPRVRPT